MNAAPPTELLPVVGVDVYAGSYNNLFGLDERVRMRPMDHLTTAISPQEAVDLVAGCALVAGVIQKEQPDIVFFPQRGAGPIEWTTSEVLRQEGAATPLFVDLPLGTRTDSETGKKFGISGIQKLEVVSSMLQQLFESGQYVPGQTKLMIVDEVQKGGTITQAAEALRRAAQDHEDEQRICIVAVQDSRNNQIGDTRTSGYQKLATNERESFVTYVLPTKLFTVDRDRYLDAIIPNAAHDNGGSPLSGVSIVKNEEARELFLSMVRSYYQPDIAQEELSMISRGEIAANLGHTLLQFAMVDTITDQRDVVRPVSSEIMTAWWNKFVRIAKSKQLS